MNFILFILFQYTYYIQVLEKRNPQCFAAGKIAGRVVGIVSKFCTYVVCVQVTNLRSWFLLKNLENEILNTGVRACVYTVVNFYS